MTGDLRENAMFGEQLRYDHLREEDLVDLVQELPCHPQFKLVRFVKLDRDHEAFAAHFFDEGMFRPQRVDALHQHCSHLRGVLDKFLVIDHVERGKSAGHGEIVAPEGCRMHDAAIHAAERFLINLASRDDRAAGHVAATKRLRERDDVGLEIPMLKTKHFSRATKPGLALRRRSAAFHTFDKVPARERRNRFWRLTSLCLAPVR